MSNPESTYIQGPYDLDPQTIDAHVEKNRPGIYSLVRIQDVHVVFFKTSKPCPDLNEAIKDEVGNPERYKHFTFSYS
jgi:hypothetical protein